MTKFKVGDKVDFKGNKSYKGVVQKVQPLFGHETIYTIKWNDGKQYDVTEGDLVIANSVRNIRPVRAPKSAVIGATEIKTVKPEGQKVPLKFVRGKDGHYYVIFKDGQLDYGSDIREATKGFDEAVRFQSWTGTHINSVRSTNARRVRVLKAGRLVPDYLVGQIVEVVGGRGDDVFVKDPKFPRLNIPILLKKGEYEVANSVRSTNSVVVKALNSVGYNPSDKQDWSIHSVTAHGTWIKKRVHDMTLREAIAEAKKRRI